MSLAQSVLFNFLSEEHGISAHFLEGQELVQNLATITHLRGSSFAGLRDFVLSAKPLISFLAPGEGFGVYIDSEMPYFRFKIEANQSGSFRTLILPTELKAFPDTLFGVCRITKVFKNNSSPYTSIIELKNTPFSGVMDKILQNSYQIQGHCYLSETSDQSLLLVKIPPKHLDESLVSDPLSHVEFWEKHHEKIEKFFQEAHNSRRSIVEFFDSLGFKYLGEKPVNFHCPCSREQMIAGLISVIKSSNEDLFQGSDSLETKCDYCQTYYQINKDELKDSI